MKPGYKQTEVGVIPEDWECTTVRRLVDAGILEKPLDGNHGNIHPKGGDFVSFGIPFVMANNIKGGQVDLTNCSFIRKEQADSLQKGFSRAGDVLLTHKATIGSEYPPAGRVRISAPQRMNLDTIRVFAISKLGWIKQQQRKLRQQERETPREYLNRESHYLWGKRCLLRVVERDQAPSLEIQHSHLLVRVPPETTDERKQEIVAQWYRTEMRAAVPALIARWTPVMGVTVERFYVQQMKTKWGSCNPSAGTIRLNTDLAKKPKECLEYIVVHEMAHLLEPTHNARFIALMDGFMPSWRLRRDQLNRLPVRHEEWAY